MSSASTMSSYPSQFPEPGGSRDQERQLPAPTIFDKETIQSLPRQYIITVLLENGYSDLAASLKKVPNPDDQQQVHDALREIAAALNEEREEQFKDMLTTLSPNEDNLKQTYDTISSEMFKGKTHWGKVVTFIVFTSHLVLYCAEREKLRSKVPEVMEWSDVVMKERLHDWIQEQGGWQAFVEHYDLENWRVSLSTAVLGLGATIMVASGFAALKGLSALKQLFF